MTAVRAVKTIFCLAAFTLLSGCAAEKSDTPVPAPFASGAIVLKLNARPDLNEVNGLANSCSLLLLQAPDKAALKKTLASPAALKAFFAGSGAEAEEGRAILAVDRYVMMPGQSVAIHIDRVAEARHVALVAGYYPFPDSKQMWTAAIPVIQSSGGWWRPKAHRQLRSLRLSATLGARGFIDIKNESGNSLDPTATNEDTKQ